MKHLTTPRPGTAVAISLGLLLLLASVLGDSALAQTKKKKTEKRQFGLPRILNPFSRAGGPSTTASSAAETHSGADGRGGNHSSGGRLLPFDLFSPPPAETTGSEVPGDDDDDYFPHEYATTYQPDDEDDDYLFLDDYVDTHLPGDSNQGRIAHPDITGELPTDDFGAIEGWRDRFVPDDRPETGYYFPTGRAFQRALLTPRSQEFEAPGPDELFAASGDSFFNPGETQFNIGIGGALGNLSEINRIQTTVGGTRVVEKTKTVTRQVQTGKRRVQRRNPNLAETQRQIRLANQKLANATNPIQANRLLQKQGLLFRQANRQIANPRTKTVPVVQNRQFTTREEDVDALFEQIIEELEREGPFDEDSPKLALGVTHFLNNHVGIGGQAEWIQGNLDDAFLGLAELTYRVPMEFDNFGLAPYLTGGVGGITGGGINEFVGAVGGGIELRLQDDVGIFTEYSHNFLGNGMDFGQILAGLNVVIGKNRVPKTPGSRSGGGGSFDFPLELLQPVEPFPVDTSLEGEVELRSDNRRELDPDDFEPPVGYPRPQD